MAGQRVLRRAGLPGRIVRLAVGRPQEEGRRPHRQAVGVAVEAGGGGEREQEVAGRQQAVPDQPLRRARRALAAGLQQAVLPAAPAERQLDRQVGRRRQLDDDMMLGSELEGVDVDVARPVERAALRPAERQGRGPRLLVVRFDLQPRDRRPERAGAQQPAAARALQAHQVVPGRQQEAREAHQRRGRLRHRLDDATAGAVVERHPGKAFAGDLEVPELQPALDAEVDIVEVGVAEAARQAAARRRRGGRRRGIVRLDLLVARRVADRLQPEPVGRVGRQLAGDTEEMPARRQREAAQRHLAAARALGQRLVGLVAERERQRRAGRAGQHGIDQAGALLRRDRECEIVPLLEQAAARQVTAAALARRHGLGERRVAVGLGGEARRPLLGGGAQQDGPARRQVAERQAVAAVAQRQVGQPHDAGAVGVVARHDGRAALVEQRQAGAAAERGLRGEGPEPARGGQARRPVEARLGVLAGHQPAEGALRRGRQCRRQRRPRLEAQAVDQRLAGRGDAEEVVARRQEERRRGGQRRAVALPQRRLHAACVLGDHRGGQALPGQALGRQDPEPAGGAAEGQPRHVLVLGRGGPGDTERRPGVE